MPKANLEVLTQEVNTDAYSSIKYNRGIFAPIRKKYIRIQWEYSVDDSLTINWPSIDPWLNFSHANEGAVNSFAYSRNQLTIVECSYILCAVDHCWILLYFPCGWPLLNSPIFSVRLTTVERFYIFCAVDHCWTLLFFLCSWPLLNAHIFSVRLTTVECSYIFFVCLMVG